MLLTGSVAVAATVAALAVGVVTGGVPLGAEAAQVTSARTSPPRAGDPAIARPAAPAKPVVRGALTAPDGTATGPVTGGTTVVVHGSGLAAVTAVEFGGARGTVVSATDDTVTVTTPPAAGFAEGPVAVQLLDATGRPVTVAPPTPVAAPGPDPAADSATASVGDMTPLVTPPGAAQPSSDTSADTSADAATHQGEQQPAPRAKAASPAPVPAASLIFSYGPDPRITAQIAYTLAHWNNYNRAAYGVIARNDCVNFTSQTLIARGWTMDADWWFNPQTGQSSSAWESSTAMAAYLAAHPERATALTDAQRSLVKVGDIVQFDWDRSGDRDHTGIVTRVDRSAAGVTIFYAGHTLDSDFASVDESLANTGGTVSYWSLAH